MTIRTGADAAAHYTPTDDWADRQQSASMDEFNRNMQQQAQDMVNQALQNITPP
jgi:hypothetical protein